MAKPLNIDTAIGTAKAAGFAMVWLLGQTCATVNSARRRRAAATTVELRRCLLLIPERRLS